MTTRQRTAGSVWQEVGSCQRLIQLHHALVRLCPARGSDSALWRDYYLRSAAAYEQVAKIDLDHHHESLYCAGRERRKAEAIAQGATGPVGGVSDTIYVTGTTTVAEQRKTGTDVHLARSARR